jgi:hypothetical protein
MEIIKLERTPSAQKIKRVEKEIIENVSEAVDSFLADCDLFQLFFSAFTSVSHLLYDTINHVTSLYGPRTPLPRSLFHPFTIC